MLRNGLRLEEAAREPATDSYDRPDVGGIQFTVNTVNNLTMRRAGPDNNRKGRGEIELYRLEGTLSARIPAPITRVRRLATSHVIRPGLDDAILKMVREKVGEGGRARGEVGGR